jgi:hypothetical protein
MLFIVSVVSEVQAQSPTAAKLKSEDWAVVVYATEYCFSSFILTLCIAITIYIRANLSKN